jgi:predicted esterase
MRRLVIFALMACSLAVTAQTKQTFQYAQRDSALFLDVWTPANPRSDSACVVALFGGGFVIGNRDDEYQTAVAKVLTERGFYVVSPDYRLGLKDSAMVASHSSLSKVRTLFQWTIDIATEDCAAAVAYVLQHAAELGISKSHLVLTGCSAGAVTVLQLDYCRANSLLQVAVLPQGWMPAAVVPYAGAIMCKGKPKYSTAPAPTMLMHGMKDKIVNYKRFPPVLRHALYGAATVYKQQRKAGYDCWIVRFEGIGHEVASWLPGSVDLFCGFVEQAFAGRHSSLDATMTDSKLTPTKWTEMNVFDIYK